MKHEILAEGIEIYCGDCLDVLPLIGEVSACVTDPPYGCGVKYGEAYNDLRNDYWEWFAERRTAILSVSPLACFTHRNHALKYISDWDWIGVWNKPGSFGSRIGNSFILPHWEPIFFYGIHARGVHTEYLGDVLTFNPQPARAGHGGMDREKWQGGGLEGKHPTPKPLPLIRQLVSVMANPGETVLDPFMGSGTTGVASIQSGRKFIGIEIEPKYYDIAKKRIQSALDAPDMFIKTPEKPIQSPFQFKAGE